MLKRKRTTKCSTRDSLETNKREMEPLPPDLPQKLREIHQLSQALCTVYTFATVKQVVMTIDKLISSLRDIISRYAYSIECLMDKHRLRRDITLTDLGLLKALAPEIFELEYQLSSSIRMRKGGDIDLYQITNHTKNVDVLEDEYQLVLRFLDHGDCERKFHEDFKSNIHDRFSKIYKTNPLQDQKKILTMIHDRQLTLHQSVIQFHLGLKEKHGEMYALDFDWDYLAKKSLPLNPSNFPSPTLSTRSVDSNVHISSADKVVEVLRSQPFSDQKLIYHHRMEGAKPIYGKLQLEIHPRLVQGLMDWVNINVKTNLYQHQTEAINAIMNGKHVVISTSTSSGKSMIYNIPLCHTLLQQATELRHGKVTKTAIFLFPTVCSTRVSKY